MKTLLTSGKRCDGFSLVEVVIAIGIAAFCLVAMLGLIPAGMKSVKATIEQTTATSLASEIATDLRCTPLGSNVTTVYGLTLPSYGMTNGANATNATNFYLGESGGYFPANKSLDAKYGVSLSMSNSSQFLTVAKIMICWPSTTLPSTAGALPSNALGSVEAITTILRQ